jgi:hypothetical protein
MDVWADFAFSPNAVQATVLREAAGYIHGYIPQHLPWILLGNHAGNYETGVILSHYLRLHL